MKSWIERNAFSVLLRKETASIKDMRPTDVPANQFSYHLNNLIQQKYIHKIDRGKYALTPFGLRYAGKLSTATNKQSDNIKTVIILYGKTRDGRVSLFEWSRQPYINMKTLPHDRVAYDCSLSDAVNTACIDKLGKVVDVQYKVSAMITISHQLQTISRMHGLVYEFNTDDIAYPHKARNGTLVLARPGECTDLMEGMINFIQQLDMQLSLAPIEARLTY